MKPMLPRRMMNHTFQNRPTTKLKISNTKKSKPDSMSEGTNETTTTATVSKSNDDFRKLLGL